MNVVAHEWMMFIFIDIGVIEYIWVIYCDYWFDTYDDKYMHEWMIIIFIDIGVIEWVWWIYCDYWCDTYDDYYLNIIYITRLDNLVRLVDAAADATDGR